MFQNQVLYRYIENQQVVKWRQVYVVICLYIMSCFAEHSYGNSHPAEMRPDAAALE